MVLANMVTIKYEVPIGMVPTEGWTAESSHLYPPSRLPRQHQEPTPSQGNIREQDRQQAMEDSQIPIDNAILSTDEPTPPRRGCSFGELTNGSSWDVGCQCSGTNKPCQTIVAMQEPVPSWVKHTWTHFSKPLMAGQQKQKPAPVESYQDHLARLEQQNKSRLMKVRQQQDALISSSMPNWALINYEAQLANLERRNKQRLAAEQQAQDAGRPNVEVNTVQSYTEPSINLQQQNRQEVIETSNRSGRQHEVPLPKHIPNDNSKKRNTPENHALQDYHEQLMLLELISRKRIMEARQEQDNMMAWAKSSSLPGGSDITQPAAQSSTEESRPLELRGPAPS